MKETQEGVELNAQGHVRHETRDAQQHVEYKKRKAREYVWHVI